LAEQGVELAGVDLNSALIKEAARLARAENLPCQFVHGDAFSPKHSGQIYLSTGVMHHFRGDSLVKFLHRHDQPAIRAFLHYDFPAVVSGAVWLVVFSSFADANGNRAS